MKSRFALLVAAMCVATACNQDARQAQGFTLPEGNADEGREAFARLGCNSCHVVDGVERPEAPELSIQLGGETAASKTYGELVTAVINPTHRTSRAWLNANVLEQAQSRMGSYNEVMTVEELVDIVSFLQSQYQVSPYTKTRYLEYYRKKQQEG